MAYKCPKCGDPVQRGYSSSAQMTAGLVGSMFYAAFGKFEYEKCGKIAQSEFPKEDRTKMTLISTLLINGAIALAIVVIIFIADM